MKIHVQRSAKVGAPGLVNFIRDHPLSTYAPRGRGGGYPKAYVVREVA